LKKKFSSGFFPTTRRHQILDFVGLNGVKSIRILRILRPLRLVDKVSVTASAARLGMLAVTHIKDMGLWQTIRIFQGTAICQAW
jgi:hypothetical protein